MKAIAKHLAQDGILLYPTETVWGLGVRADSQKAIEALNQFKGRQEGQPMSLLVPHRHWVREYAYANSKIKDLISLFWPGPVTFVLPAKENVLPEIHAGTHCVGLRCSPHPFLKALMEELDFAITTTSANRSGEKPISSLKDWPSTKEVLAPSEELLSSFPYELDQEPSLVVKMNLENNQYQVLRKTAYLKQFQEVAHSMGFKL